ncbi:MAG: hypothetical protein EOP83_32860 [Verrucomicrobiaceae bacterium]|nr:MAG: hypothetical protein EOP83_32860 [Verrucomicrobiaceae bacterium]
MNESAKTQGPRQIDPTPVSLLYYISDADMRKLTLGPPDEDDPFAGMGADYKYPSQQLAKAGLPLPKGTSATRVYNKVIINAPRSYHDQVAALLGVKGMPSPKPEDTSADPTDSLDR